VSDISLANSLNWTSPLSSVTSATSASTQAAITSAAESSGTGATTPAASVQISPGGQLVSMLQQLQQNDPSQFQSTVSQMAKQLQTAAQSAGTSTQDGQFLSNMASKLTAVANGTASISSLQPPAPPSGQSGQSGVSGHHHHHHGGSESDSTSSSTSSTSSSTSSASGSSASALSYGNAQASTGLSQQISSSAVQTAMQQVFATLSNALAGVTASS
jgi:hypothetical protein